VNKTVGSVIEDINEWENPRGGFVYYVTAMFTDESVGSVGKLTKDDAQTVQAQLRDAIGEELDFTVEDGGMSQGGRQKWKIKGFGPPGGAATYTAPGVQGVGQAPGNAPGTSTGSNTGARGTRLPEPSSEQASIRASVALKAAVELIVGADIAGDINTALEIADTFNAWMLEKTFPGDTPPDLTVKQTPDGGANLRASELALSAYPSTDSPSVTPAGASSEAPSDSARASEPTLIGAGSESGGGVATEGKEPAPPPHIEVGLGGGGDEGIRHQHDWQAHPNLHGWLMCSCGENRRKSGLQDREIS
jgi:hypothetical protein